MESDKSPHYPCDFAEDEFDIIENLMLGNTPRRDRDICGCTNGSSCTMPTFADSVSRAIVYSPDHAFDDMYDPTTGLMEGTLFKALNKPFMGASVRGGNR